MSKVDFGQVLAAYDRGAAAIQGLPAGVYADPATLEEERRGIFRRHWIAVGFAHDVPQPGDVAPVAAPDGTPLLLTRDRSGSVHVLVNVCRHRGMCLVEEKAAGVARIVCPYHAWSYDLDGRLRRAPHYHGFEQHGGEEVADVVGGLERVRHALWNGLVFVNLSGDAEPFADFVAPLAGRWAHLDMTGLAHGHSLRFALAANWKLACENFVDIYHISKVHPSLNRYNSKMQHHEFVDIGRDFIGSYTDRFTPADNAAGTLPKIPRVAGEPVQFNDAMAVFPNLLLTLFDDHFRAIIVEPDGHDRAVERVAVFFPAAAMTDELAEHRRIAAERFPVFNDEDVAVCEGLQRSFARHGFPAGYLSPYFDETVRRYQRRYCEAMAAARG
ncbi:MAG: aromatic ring-hydroxylating dioxygenase subunit alpha [Alphaproteobacteria bacterium]